MKKNDYPWNLDNFDFISHYGVLGMKWGVRRYQNYDGSLTAAGRSRLKGDGIKYGSTTGTKYYDNKDEDSQSLSAAKLDVGIGAIIAAGGVGTTAIGMLTGNPAVASGGAFLATIGMRKMTIGGIELAAVGGSTIYANSKEKKFIKEREANTNVDKKTGLKLKNREMTQKEDMARVNPGYMSANANTKNNCSSCAVTYDLRRRGYDVTAQKAITGVDYGFIKNIYKNAKYEEATGGMAHSEIESLFKSRANTSRTKENTRYESVGVGNKAKKEMNANADAIINKQPTGSRGYISVTWDKMYSGHALAYEKTETGFLIIDAQTNKTYKSFEELSRKTGGMSNISIARTDNLKLNTGELKEVCKS